MDYTNISPEEVVSVCSQGPRFLNGFPRAFLTDFPPALQGRLPEADFHDFILKVNSTLAYYWPCTTAIILGYLCSPLTCGLSLLLPRTCVLDAARALERKLRHYNKAVLGRHRLQVRLFWEGCECRLDFHFLDDFESFVSSSAL